MDSCFPYLQFIQFFLIFYCIFSQGFYYDAFYGDVGLNEDHFKQIFTGACKAVTV